MAKYAGDVWINKRTKQLRYGGGGSQDQWLQPLSIYKVGSSAIRRGEPVSIKLASGSGDDNVIEKTDTTIHIKCLGLALEPGSPGDFIHVLSAGRFTYKNSDGNENTYFPPVVDTDRGKMLYVAPPSSPAGLLTLDRNAALLGSLNLIQLGYITNTDFSSGGSEVVDVEIQLEGDGRGPLENTQFELPFGEPLTIRSNYPKLYAVSPGVAASKFSYKLRLRRSACSWPIGGQNDLRFNKWIAVYSAHRAVILILGTAAEPVRSLNTGDEGRYNFITSQFSNPDNIKYYNLYTTSNPPSTWGEPAADPNAQLYTVGGAYFGNSLATAITNVVNTFLAGDVASKLSASATVVSYVNNDNVTQDIVDVNLICDSTGGPIYVEWDSALNNYFTNSKYISAGSYAVSAGSVVLADKRFPERANLAGLYIGPSKLDGPYSPTNQDRGIFLRKGLFTTTVASYSFVPGARYFLGNSGNLIAAPNEVVYPETMVEIGTAVTTKSIMVDITAPVAPRGIDYPIGTIKPTPTGSDAAESGFLLMDGQTVARQEQYEDLYRLLVAAYGQTYIDDGHANVSFIVPTLLIPGDPSKHYQIKALNLGYQPLTSILDRLTFSGTFADAPAAASLEVDITSLKNTGPKLTTESASLPTVDNVMAKLFVEVDTEQWREIPAGFYYSGSDLWGYVWKVTEATNDGEVTYTLSTDLGTAGKGVGYNTATLAGKNYQLVVYKPEMFARYYNVGAETLDPNNNFPPTSVAVAKYIDTSVSTKRLWVRGEVDVKDKLDFHLNYDILGDQTIHNPLISGAGQHDACARLGLTEDGVLVLSNTVSGVRNALGIAGKTGDAATAYIINNNASTTPILEFSSESTISNPTKAIVLRAAAFQTVSTRVAKDNIKPFNAPALDIINNTEIVEYNLKNDPDTKRVGFIAEDTNELMAGKNHDQMDLSTTVGLLLKAVQELAAEVKQIKASAV